MLDTDLRTQIRISAGALAFTKFRKDNPRATADEAHAFADRNWRNFVDMAIDFLALCEADAEASAAAPWN